MNIRQSGTILIIGTIVLLAVGGIALMVNALDQFNSTNKPPTALVIPTVLDTTLEPDTVVTDGISINQEAQDAATTTNILVAL